MERNRSRRLFIKAGLTGLVASTFLLLDRLVGRQKVITGKKVVEIPIDEHKNVIFHEDFIVINNDSGLNVLSSKCTHLGCQINKQVGEELLCPCHGSAFSLEGDVIKGPALRSLPKLDYELDISRGKIIISV